MRGTSERQQATPRPSRSSGLEELEEKGQAVLLWAPSSSGAVGNGATANCDKHQASHGRGGRVKRSHTVLPPRSPALPLPAAEWLVEKTEDFKRAHAASIEIHNAHGPPKAEKASQGQARLLPATRPSPARTQFHAGWSGLVTQGPSSRTAASPDLSPIRPFARAASPVPGQSTFSQAQMPALYVCCNVWFLSGPSIAYLLGHLGSTPAPRKQRHSACVSSLLDQSSPDRHFNGSSHRNLQRRRQP